VMARILDWLVILGPLALGCGESNAVGNSAGSGGSVTSGGGEGGLDSRGSGGGGATGGGPATGGSESSGGAAAVTCTGEFTTPTVKKVLDAALFHEGENPSEDPECMGVLNPERGVFQFRDMRSLGNLNGLRESGYSLIYGKILIDDYLDQDLDEPLLSQLADAFAAVRAAGLKVLPRLYYADDGVSPDAPLSRVLAHIAQVGPLLRSNSDVIAALHAGFVGAWGEWHGSANNLTEPDSRAQILDALLAEIPANRMIMARRPSHKQVAYGGPLSAETAFTGESLSRVAHLNDCFLASDTDMGTYQVAGEKDYALSDSAFTVTGGETCAVNPPRSECASALEELALHHFGFINTSYHQDVITSWQAGGCFDQIRCQLGYRFVLLDHESPQVVEAGETFPLTLKITNDGFSRLYNPRALYLVLRGPSELITLTTVDPRWIAPGETAELCISAELPDDITPGSYQIALWLPDDADTLAADARYALRISSGTEWEPDTGYNVLDAEVTVTP
jgi:hypothetical protein